jgi:hypothetical protein
MKPKTFGKRSPKKNGTKDWGKGQITRKEEKTCKEVVFSRFYKVYTDKMDIGETELDDKDVHDMEHVERDMLSARASKGQALCGMWAHSECPGYEEASNYV